MIQNNVRKMPSQEGLFQVKQQAQLDFKIKFKFWKDNLKNFK